MNIRLMVEVWDAAEFQSRLILPGTSLERALDRESRPELDAMRTQLAHKHIATIRERFGFNLDENDLGYDERYELSQRADVAIMWWDTTRRTAKIMNGPERGKFIGFPERSIRNTVVGPKRMVPVDTSFGGGQTFKMVEQSYTFELLGWCEAEGGFVAKDVSADLANLALILDKH